MREKGTIRSFDNGQYELIEDVIIPEKDKKEFIIKLNIAVLVFTVVGIVLAAIIMKEGTFNMFEIGLLFIGYFLYLVVHELLHGITFILDKNVTWKDIKFGLVLKSGMAYCISKVPVKVQVSRLSLMMPVYLVCLPMFLFGIILNDAALLFASIIYISGSMGDFYYMWKLRNTSKHLYMFEELPTSTGYEVGYLLYKKLQ